jgi:hypothetical protein
MKDEGKKMFGKFLIRHWLTIIMVFICLGLVVWTWLALQDMRAASQSLGLFGSVMHLQTAL